MGEKRGKKGEKGKNEGLFVNFYFYIYKYFIVLYAYGKIKGFTKYPLKLPFFDKNPPFF